MENDLEKYRDKIIGLGEHSLHKSYYPELQEKSDHLKSSQKNLQTVIDSISDGIIIHDINGEVLSFNEKAKNSFNLNEKESTNYSVFDLLAPSQDRDEILLILQKVESGTPQIIECIGIQLTTNREIELQVSLSPTLWNEKQAIVAVIRDFTERKKFEQALIDSKEKAENANRLKTEFLNNMSHEIRTPMNGIIGFSSLLEEQHLSHEKQVYYSQIIINSSHQLLKIIDDILEISTLETKQITLLEEEFCLNDLLMELFSVFNLKAKERNIPIYVKKQFHNSQSFIIADKSKINKILSKLLENALKFTFEGFIEIGYYLENDKLVIYVKDTGIGISQKDREIIFERFSQVEKGISRKHGGLGLGLSISKENAKLMGGDISIESEKGQGSTFYITIPYNSSRKPVTDSLDTTKDNANNQNKNITILVAEDEEINYFFLEALFEKNTNFTLIHAKNGKEAVEICLANKDIDLVLMDIKMPIMNGHEAAEKIKSKLPNLPIIAQTAYSTESDKKLALKHGCDDFISKPLKKDKLFALIRSYIKG